MLSQRMPSCAFCSCPTMSGMLLLWPCAILRASKLCLKLVRPTMSRAAHFARCCASTDFPCTEVEQKSQNILFKSYSLMPGHAMFPLLNPAECLCHKF